MACTKATYTRRRDLYPPHSRRAMVKRSQTRGTHVQISMAWIAVAVADSKIHECDGWKNCSSIDLRNRNLVNLHGSFVREPPSALRRGRSNSVLLDIEFCPPPVTPLGIILGPKWMSINFIQAHRKFWIRTCIFVSDFRRNHWGIGLRSRLD